MIRVEIGRIERVPLREVWPHEAHALTTWMADNLDLLGDSLGISLSLIQREHSVGSFNVDLVAQDGDGSLVVIENQLERSDHDHLGKVITYASMVDAKRAIWIVSDPRPEHLKAIQWLNEQGKISFHLLRIEAIRIGDSKPAPMFTVITGPSESSADVRRIKNNQEESISKYEAFWRALLNAARTKTSLHKNISPGKGNWISTTVEGFTGFGLGYVLARGKGRVELYIDSEKKGKDYCEAVLHALESRKETIEEAFGAPLVWEELPDGRACRICFWLPDKVNLDDQTTWPNFIHQMVDGMIRLNNALRQFLSAAMNDAEQAISAFSTSDDIPIDN